MLALLTKSRLKLLKLLSKPVSIIDSDFKICRSKILLKVNGQYCKFHRDKPKFLMGSSS